MFRYSTRKAFCQAARQTHVHCATLCHVASRMPQLPQWCSTSFIPPVYSCIWTYFTPKVWQVETHSRDSEPLVLHSCLQHIKLDHRRWLLDTMHHILNTIVQNQVLCHPWYCHSHGLLQSHQCLFQLWLFPSTLWFFSYLVLFDSVLLVFVNITGICGWSRDWTTDQQ
jgi:hypothetical protein